jgi:hypothetical protein
MRAHPLRQSRDARSACNTNNPTTIRHCAVMDEFSAHSQLVPVPTLGAVTRRDERRSGSNGSALIAPRFCGGTARSTERDIRASETFRHPNLLDGVVEGCPTLTGRQLPPCSVQRAFHMRPGERMHGQGFSTAQRDDSIGHDQLLRAPRSRRHTPPLGNGKHRPLAHATDEAV